MNDTYDNYFEVYNKTDFAKRVDEVIDNPKSLDSKESTERVLATRS